jgi:quercetin dioxygenase-like cupin family protein
MDPSRKNWKAAASSLPILPGAILLSPEHAFNSTRVIAVMSKLPGIVGVALLFASAHASETAVVAPLMKKALPDVPGKEMLMITVSYPPGYSGEVHRHDAHSIVYVLEGSVVMQVRGGKEVTLKAGQTFYEGPDDVHTVGRNASKTEPAKLVVVLLKKEGADVVLPAE